MRPNNIYRVLFIMFAGALFLVACGEQETPEQRLARIQQHINNLEYRSAVIELKSLLESFPDNANGRWLLGGIYLDFEDGQSAEKEFRRAQALGVGEDAILPALARTLLLQEKNDAVLALEATDVLSERSLAELTATKGLAQLNLKNSSAARQLVKAALASEPNSVWTRYSEAKLLYAEKRYGDAERAILSMLKVDPDNGAAWSLLGDVYAADRDFAKAEEAFTEAIAKKRVARADLLKRGSARLGQGDLEGASADADLLEQYGDKSSLALYFRGLIRFQQAKYAEAADILEKVHAKNDRHFPTTFLLAATHYRLNNRERARALSERVVALAPRFIAGRKLLASVYLQQRDGEKAAETIRIVVDAGPEDLEAKQLFAAGLMQQGMVDDAASYYAEIAAEQEDVAYAQLRAGVAFLSAGQNKKAIHALQKAVVLAPDDANLQAASISGLLRGKMAEEAVEAALRFTQQQPTDAEAWSLLGSAYLQGGQLQAAHDAFEKALVLSPGHLSASKGLARLAVQDEDLATARRYLEASLVHNAGDAGLSVRLADIDYWEKKPADAKAILQRAIHTEPKRPAPKTALARLLLEQGDAVQAAELLADVSLNEFPAAGLLRAEALYQLRRYGEARVLLEQLAERLPESPQAHFALAVIYSEIGERDRFKASLDRLLEVAPELPAALLVKARLLAVEGKSDEAINLLENLDIRADEPAILKTRLFIARQAGENEKELKYAQDLFRFQPSTMSVVALATALGRNGASDKREATLVRWLESNPDDVVVLQVLAAVYVRSGRTADAIALQERILEKEPDSVPALNNLAWHLRKTVPKKSLVYAKQAYELAPDSLAVVDTYAEVLARNGNVDLALLLIDGQIRKIPGQSVLALRRAEILHFAGEQARALEELEALLLSTASEDIKAEARTLIAKWRG